ncbi:MAG: NAD-dependent succinate-semialdehyde dehydrogenase [Hyphomicrobiales bacterium]|nr:NAD-dependent succinate-semialdehyde dehydrogenase [Hyphomicrobiales bacterium]MCP5370309.1 NAD-dependent succinate-semialdehyde dehydrogenase [Hyphomicrobiales bacterium]
MYENLALFIDGQWRSGDGRATETVINPATEAALGELPHATDADLDDALAAARRAFGDWRRRSPTDRGAILRQAAAILRARAEEVAANLVAEEGKSLTESRIEVMVAAEVLDWSAEEGRRQYGRLIPPRGPGFQQAVVPEPIGVCAQFAPWNFPAIFPARKISEALAAGCTCIIKPSEEVPASAIAIVRALEEAGLPPGVVNLVFGVPDTISRRLLASPVVRKLSFTGSIPVGKHLMRLAADNMVKTTMELGGHAPAIVFDDVDVDQVAAILTASKFRNAGQVCNSPTRFFVHEAVYDRFAAALAAAARGVRVGNGMDDGVVMGPLANARRREAIEGFVADALDRGAELLAGGARLENKGFFYAPTILGDVPDTARIMREEPFGPVAALTRFADTDEMLARANGLPFGLAGYAYTRGLANAQAVRDGLQVGLLGINTPQIALAETPFGGMKESGHGSEGGSEGVAGYMTTKFVSQLAL